MTRKLTRRAMLQTGLAAASAAALGAHPQAPAAQGQPGALTPKADSVIFIWLPGGIAQIDTWDPKRHTPFQAGMRGNELLGTCRSIPSTVDGISLGEGLENIASVMHHGTLLRTLTNETKFGAVHLKAQYYMMTGYIPPVGVKAPSIGSVVARTLGRRDPNVPPYIYIGRDIDTSDNEKLFISEYIGPGFYGVDYAPFMIPDPARGLSTLEAVSGMKREHLDRRQQLLKSLTAAATTEWRESEQLQSYLKVFDDARAMMDSPVKRAFDYRQEEKAELVTAYEPSIGYGDVRDKSYYYGSRFGHGLLLARRLVEAGARYIQVEYQYGPFKGFDMHEDGAARMVEMKQQIDRPIGQLIRDLHERGLLERTLVVISTEFGRTIASAPAAGREPDGFAERHSGEELVIESEKMYGFHGHFSSCNCLLFFGGGFKSGFVHGKTNQDHPMIPLEGAVPLPDVHATIYKALGIPADHFYVTEGRPFYVTKDGKGQAIDAMLA